MARPPLCTTCAKAGCRNEPNPPGCPSIASVLACEVVEHETLSLTTLRAVFAEEWSG